MTFSAIMNMVPVHAVSQFDNWWDGRLI